MTDAQRSILSRKIAAADLRSKAGDARAVEAGEIAGRLFDEYFGLKSKPSPIRTRVVERTRLFATPLKGAWFHFQRGVTDILVAFDYNLVAAAVAAALARQPSEANAGAASVVERHIAAILARRLAASFGAFVAGAGDGDLALVGVADTPEDFTIAKSALNFETFDRVGQMLPGAQRADFLCAIASRASAPSKMQGAETTDWRAAFVAQMRQAPVAVRANIGGVDTTIGVVLSLAPDQVLTLTRGSFEEVSLTTDKGAPVFDRCRLGEHVGKRAIQII